MQSAKEARVQGQEWECPMAGVRASPQPQPRDSP